VTKQEFIFSDKFSHRLARHASFWILWTIAYNLLFHFPIHVFKGWELSRVANENLQKLGLPLFFLKTLLINSFLAVVVPQILFTYILIYWLVPRYILKDRNRLLKIVTSFIAIILFLQLAALFKYAPLVYNHLAGMNPKMPQYEMIKKTSLIDQATSLPIVLGFVLIFVFSKRWYIRNKKTQHLQQENLNAELQLLKAQIHPHFLFNTINNIYFHTLTLSSQAPELIKKLEVMMNYFLNECNVETVELQQELDILKDYLALEKIRYGDNLDMKLSFPEDCGSKSIAPLLLIPFVENCFKHGASRSLTHSKISISATLSQNHFTINISNDIPQLLGTPINKGHIGVKNVRKRLGLLYPDAHQLQITSSENYFEVQLEIDLDGIHLGSEDNINTQRKSEYAVA
jgi:hypothetical protein